MSKAPLAIKATGEKMIADLIQKTELPLEATSGHNAEMVLISGILEGREHNALVISLYLWVYRGEWGTRLLTSINSTVGILCSASIGSFSICFHDGSDIAKQRSIKQD